MKVKKRIVYRGRVKPRVGIWHLGVWLKGELHPLCYIGDKKWVFWLKVDQGTDVDKLGYCSMCLDAGEKLGLLTKK